MYTLMYAETLAGAWEVVCYFFTVLGVTLSYFTALR